MIKQLMRCMPKAVFFFSLIFLVKGNANTSVEAFRRHLNPVFVETGSFAGDGIAKALEAGFTEVYSIELAPHLYEHCVRRFEGYSNVHLFLGDSSIILSDVIRGINQPITFWLDGHYSAGNTAIGNTNTPILEELAIIALHPIKNHTILIDDVRQFGGVAFDFIEIQDIKEAILKINPNYVFSYEDGIISHDVLVAEVL